MKTPRSAIDKQLVDALRELDSAHTAYEAKADKYAPRQPEWERLTKAKQTARNLIEQVQSSLTKS
jgi:vacuolar-type H+-ATPase subunit I/STV1